MPHSAMSNLQQSPTSPLPGTWALRPAQALSLYPAWAGVLEVARGRVWLTVTGPGGHAQACDEVLDAGARRVLQPGQHAVLEAWHRPGSAPAVALRWDAWSPPVAVAPPGAQAAAPTAELREAWQALRAAVAALRPPLVALGRSAWRMLRARGRAAWWRPALWAPRGAG